MTTIVYRDGVIAADRQAETGGTVTRCTKLFRLEGFVIGVSGNLAVGIAFKRWFEGDQDGDCPLDDSTDALVMNTQTGVCEHWETPGIGIPVEDDFVAIGSGAELAYGAMEMGADAKKAIKVASKWDSSTGNGIQAVKK